METAELQGEEFQVVRRVARNSLFLFSSTGLGIITRFAIIPIIARYLGLESFGFYALIIAISMAITPIANFGVERIICREISKNQTNSDVYLSTSIIAKIILSIFLFFIAIVLIGLYSPWHHSINIALIIAIVEQLVFSMGHTYIATFLAFERMEFDILVNFAHKISLFVFIIVAVIFDWGLTGIFWVRLVSSIIFLVATATLTYTLFIKPKF